MRHPWAAALFLAVVSLTAAGCGDETKNPALEAYPGSTAVGLALPPGTGVAYDVVEPYPAERVLEFIRGRVPAGFQPRAEDFMNPGVPTSHVRGWTKYADGTTKPPTFVHHWASEWEDAEGTILSYDLMYRSPGEEWLERPTTTTLRVTGHSMTKAWVDELRKHAVQPAQQPTPRPPGRPATNPSYLVLRPLRTESFPGAQTAEVYGQTFYFDNADVILDLSGFDLDSVETSEMGSSHVVGLSTSASGEKKLYEWSTANVGRHLGVFLDSRLVSAPTLSTPVSSQIVIDGQFSKEEAEAVAARIKRGG